MYNLIMVTLLDSNNLKPIPGSMIELLGSKHDKYSKQLHGQIERGKSFRNIPELNAQYNKFREEYWKERIAEVERNEKNVCARKRG